MAIRTDRLYPNPNGSGLLSQYTDFSTVTTTQARAIIDALDVVAKAGGYENVRLSWGVQAWGDKSESPLDVALRRNAIYGALIEKALAGGLITQEDLQKAKAEYDAAA